jgi:leader peptidase (prepilin peptidase)/N-methyltransferase
MIIWTICWLALFILASWIDFKSFILPDWITLTLMFSGFTFNTWNSGQFCSSFDSLLGIVIGYGLIRLVDALYFKYKKQRGIGQGDAKLLAAIGAILGWQEIFPVLFFAAVSGLVVGLIMIKMKRLSLQNPIPFGPFLSLWACVLILGN